MQSQLTMPEEVGHTFSTSETISLILVIIGNVITAEREEQGLDKICTKLCIANLYGVCVAPR